MAWPLCLLFRCSTSKQEKAYSHQAQRRACERFCEDNGIEILKSFKETASGRAGFDNRPVLQQAIEYARKHNAVLVVAKLCRLSRKVSEVARIVEEAKLPLMVANIGKQLDSLVINLLSSVNAFEAEMISQRTKEGLAAAKAAGVKLGNPKIHLAQKASAKVRGGLADDFAANLAPTINALVKSGIERNSHIAKHLNQIGVKTRRGGTWSFQSVKNLRARIEAMA